MNHLKEHTQEQLKNVLIEFKGKKDLKSLVKLERLLNDILVVPYGSNLYIFKYYIMTLLFNDNDIDYINLNMQAVCLMINDVKEFIHYYNRLKKGEKI